MSTSLFFSKNIKRFIFSFNMNSINSLYQCRLCLKRTPTKVNVLAGDFPKNVGNTNFYKDVDSPISSISLNSKAVLGKLKSDCEEVTLSVNIKAEQQTLNEEASLQSVIDKVMKLRPHICEFCGTGFSSSYALKTHKRQHTNEKPFKCEFCDEGFRQKVSLRSHLKSKHNIEEPKEHFCKICDKGFATSYALSIHARLHMAEKCEVCSETFAEKDYLKNHLKEAHNIIDDSVESNEENIKSESINS
ncbi:hypothetical protein NQ314_000688 [Rhamnusium bicolor]|uniref:C2H2-type domain-containing protein n=1 Tax=Rhamnusium bicolor TaxID=1586634 RepID=A0AAV8ZTY9_9CUCU|nr:hypothetical protein NQ314_000688 [Rhamnusium bicolor]